LASKILLYSSPILLDKQKFQEHTTTFFYSGFTKKILHYLLHFLFTKIILQSLLHLLAASRNTYSIIRRLFFIQENTTIVFSRSPHGHGHTGCVIAQARRAAAPFFLVWHNRTTTSNHASKYLPRTREKKDVLPTTRVQRLRGCLV
jgi:hypothetical protein